jgi:dynein heavy chain, axonemal
MTDEDIAHLPTLLPAYLVFSLVWSVGASCDNKGRQVFDMYLRDQIEKLGSSFPVDSMFPASSSVYDWCYDRVSKTLSL